MNSNKIQEPLRSTTKKSPVFIGGAGRSGTTLLRVMLNAHPNMSVGPEFKMLPSIANLYNQFTSEGFKDILQSYYLDNQKVNHIFAEFIKVFFEPLREETGSHRILEKTPHNILIMKELAQIFPEAKFLHVVRDGRDVVSSLIKMDWMSQDGVPLWYVQNVENATKYWVDVVMTGIQLASDPILRGKVKIVKYEELVKRPKEVLGKILDFIDEPWDDLVLDYHKIERQKEPIESSTEQVSNKLYTNSMKRWQREFSDQDKATFKKIGGPLLIKLGYENSEEW